MKLVQKRIGKFDMSALYAGELLELDEALEVMEYPDIKMIQKDQKAVAGILGAKKKFVSDLGKKVAALRAAGKIPDSKSFCVGKKDTRTPVEASIPHAIAISRFPPGASLWQARKKRQWQCHVPPRPRIHEPWGGNDEVALTAILKRAWGMYLEMSKLSWEHCPYKFK